MAAIIDAQTVRAAVLALPEIAAWPDAARWFASNRDEARFDWQLPCLACQAAGGQPDLAVAAAAAMACLQTSIILVDDVLDDDPRGDFRRIGHGRAANLAQALQAAAFTLINQAPVAAPLRAAAAAALAAAALTTAYGQELDAQNLHGEADYWRVVRTKSTPFYAAALQIGGILAGAAPEVVGGLHAVGALLGEIIQVIDDLTDAFENPANPDWEEGRNNLAILFASSAEHAHRQRFRELLAQVGSADRLQEAQQILIRCGAASYCVYLTIQQYQAAWRKLQSLDLADASPVAGLLARQMLPIRQWLEQLALPVPPELSGVGA